jgi:hypothetical protein
MAQMVRDFMGPEKVCRTSQSTSGMARLLSICCPVETLSYVILSSPAVFCGL